MSKFLDESQKAQGPKVEQDAGPSAGFPSENETLGDEGPRPEPAARLASDLRTEQCRKIRLPQSADSLILSSEGSRIAQESYRALRTRLMRLQAVNNLRSVVLSSAAPGEGKTLTTLNLAICCAQLHDVRVLAMDGDLRTCGLSAMAGQPPVPGLAEVLAGRATFDSAIAATQIPNLFVLGGGAAPTSPVELFASRRWAELMRWCGQNFNLILVDSPPMLPLADFELISSACDGILIVVRALQTPRALLKKASAHLDAKKLLGVVYNASELENQYQSYPYYNPSRNGHSK